MVTLQNDSLHPVSADSEGRRLAQDEFRQAILQIGLADHLEDPAGATFFHDGRGQGGIQRTRLQDALQGMGRMLWGQVIEVTADFSNFLDGMSILN